MRVKQANLYSLLYFVSKFDVIDHIPFNITRAKFFFFLGQRAIYYLLICSSPMMSNFQYNFLQKYITQIICQLFNDLCRIAVIQWTIFFKDKRDKLK